MRTNTLVKTFGAISFLVTGCALDPTAVEEPSVAQAASAYTVEPYMTPTALRVDARMTTTSTSTSVTRYLAFTSGSNTLRITVPLTRPNSTSNVWTATVALTGNSVVQALVSVGNRGYWDNMSFENRGGSVAFDIQWIKFYLDYDNLNSLFTTKSFMVAQEGGVTLPNGNASLALGRYGRRKFIEDYLVAKGAPGVSVSSLPATVQAIIDDLGKSGSDNTDSFTTVIPNGVTVANPKFGGAGQSEKCSEAVSWYFAQNRKVLWDTANQRYYNFVRMPFNTDGTFRSSDTEVVGVWQMVAAFRESDRLYCYHLGLKKFMKVDRSMNWRDLNDPTNEYGLNRNKTDFAGDYLARLTYGNEHSMILLSYDKASSVAQVLEGPWPVDVREVDIHAQEEIEQDYCLGDL